jgi:hypothetical protein
MNRAGTDDAYDAGYLDEIRITVSRKAAGVRRVIHARSTWYTLPDLTDISDEHLVGELWRLVNYTDPGNGR